MTTKFYSRITFILDPCKKIMKSSKKIQKILKPLPATIFSQNRMRKTEKVKTKFYFRIPFILDLGKKIPKKIEKKIQKIIKPLPSIIFGQKGTR